LVSVRNAAEARTAVAAGADLVDAKDPQAGALGALRPDLVRAVVAAVEGRALTSAVAGEPGSMPALLAEVGLMAACGVAMVKVALAGELAGAAALGRVRSGAVRPARVVAVLFAEDGVSPERVGPLARAGFCGAMIDTRGKSGRRLPDLVPPDQLGAFVAACAAHGLTSGLAGSLTLGDIPALAALRPDFLGFRGGLCRGGDRTAALDAARVAEAARLLAAYAGRLAAAAGAVAYVA
jgi:uncharacterized protein (UPF0264 family)